MLNYFLISGIIVIQFPDGSVDGVLLLFGPVRYFVVCLKISVKCHLRERGDQPAI